MTRCYEYYCLFVFTPEKCELSVTGQKYVKAYIKKLQAEGVQFNKTPDDKELFFVKQAEIGTERGKTSHNCDPPPLPEGVFNVVYADPPWKYEFSKSPRGDPNRYYRTLTTQDIIEFYEKELKEHVADDAVLFLWATNPKLVDALKVVDAWGFDYRTNMVWVKDKIGTGFHFRGQHELLLVAKKGSLPVPETQNRFPSVLQAPRHEHSQKPAEVYEIIEQMYPDHAYLELYARQKRPNWESWGDEVAN